MAKRDEPTLSLSDTKPAYERSLARFIQESSLLAESVRVMLKLEESLKPPIREKLTERLAAFDAAYTGEEG